MLNSYQTPLQGERIGIVFGCFAPLHQGHMDLIMRAKKENDGGVIVISCGYNGDRGEEHGIPHAKRYRYVRETFTNDDKVAVYFINDDEIGAERYPNGWNKWMDAFNRIWQHAVIDWNKTNRVWYVGEKEYAEKLRNVYGEYTILAMRTDNPISATMIRQNPIKHWDKIIHPFHRIFSHNILITGTASEGKTTLVQDLGRYFNAPVSHEYARDYMRESCVDDWELNGADFIAFLQGQYALNRSLINSPANHGVFFADTDALVTKMYAEKYAEDNDCALTQQEYATIATMADELTAKSRWDKIFCLVPANVYVDDHERFMKHSDMDSRNDLLHKLISHLTAANLLDKVVFLNGGDYYKNFTTIVSYVKEVINR